MKRKEKFDAQTRVEQVDSPVQAELSPTPDQPLTETGGSDEIENTGILYDYSLKERKSKKSFVGY